MSGLIQSIKNVLDKVEHVAGLDFRASSNKKTFEELIISVVNWMNKLNSVFLTSQNLVEKDIQDIGKLAGIVGPTNRLTAIKPFTRLFRTVLDILSVHIANNTLMISDVHSELITLTYIVADKCVETKDFVAAYENCSVLGRIAKRTFRRL